MGRSPRAALVLAAVLAAPRADAQSFSYSFSYFYLDIAATASPSNEPSAAPVRAPTAPPAPTAPTAPPTPTPSWDTDPTRAPTASPAGFAPTAPAPTAARIEQTVTASVGFTGFDSALVGTDGTSDEARVLIAAMATVLGLEASAVAWAAIADAARRRRGLLQAAPLALACTVDFDLTFASGLAAGELANHVASVLAAAAANGALADAIRAHAAAAGLDDDAFAGASVASVSVRVGTTTPATTPAPSAAPDVLGAGPRAARPRAELLAGLVFVATVLGLDAPAIAWGSVTDALWIAASRAAAAVAHGA